MIESGPERQRRTCNRIEGKQRACYLACARVVVVASKGGWMRAPVNCWSMRTGKNANTT